MGIFNSKDGSPIEKSDSDYKQLKKCTSESSFLFHPRKRRMSDSSMQVVLEDPVIYEAFRSFMMCKLSEELISFLRDVENYEKVPFESDQKVKQAETIYRKYFSMQATMSIPVDQETIDSLKENLKVNQKEQVKETNAQTLSKAFHLLYGKVYTILKFDFLPHFLASENFQEMPDVFDSLENAEEETHRYIASLNTEALLSNSYFSSYFVRFLKSNPGGGQTSLSQETRSTLSCALELIELFHEIEDFHRENNSKQHRFKRLTKILTRYGRPAESSTACALISPPLRFLEEHYLQFECRVGKYQNRPPTFFDPVKKEILHRMDNHLFPLFQADCRYKLMISGMKTAVKQSRLSKSYTKLKMLEDFAKGRSITETTTLKYNNVKAALSTTWGAYYLKRFARKRLQEENVLFCTEVNEYRKLNMKLSASAAQDLKNEDDENAESKMNNENIHINILGNKENEKKRDVDHLRSKIFQFAKRLREVYIEIDSQMQVNISDDQRSAVLEKLDKNQIDINTFNIAQKEVLKMLDQELWPAFLRDNMHKNFVLKCEENPHRTNNTIEAADKCTMTKRCSSACNKSNDKLGLVEKQSKSLTASDTSRSQIPSTNLESEIIVNPADGSEDTDQDLLDYDQAYEATNEK